jgi:hypothetical protein
VTSHEFSFDADDVEAGALGFAGAEIVEAYSSVSGPPSIGYYYDESDVDQQANQWRGPNLVGSGEDPVLARGPSGLLLLYYSVGSLGEGELEVRNWDVAEHKFGGATVLTKDPSLFGDEVGSIFWDIVGRVYVVWPGTDANGNSVMRMWMYNAVTGSWSSPVDIANISGEYKGPAHIAVYGGQGYVTFQDSEGLEIVSLFPKIHCDIC